MEGFSEPVFAVDVDGNALRYSFAERSDLTALKCEDRSLTVQSDLEDSDINTIVRRFGITGTLPQGGVRLPEYADYDEVFDFQTAQNVIADATAEFMRMPAEIRARFLNDPGYFHDFAVNPDNVDEMVRLGLAIPKPVDPPVEPMLVKVVSEEPPK